GGSIQLPGRGSKEEYLNGQRSAGSCGSAPYGLGRSGPRSATGRSGICLSALRGERSEEGTAGAGGGSPFPWGFSGPAGGRSAVSRRKAVVGSGTGGYVVRSGGNPAV